MSDYPNNYFNPHSASPWTVVPPLNKEDILSSQASYSGDDQVRLVRKMGYILLLEIMQEIETLIERIVEINNRDRGKVRGREPW